MIFLRKYIAALSAILLLLFYVIIAWLLNRSGYQHSESLFLAEKTRLLFQCKDNTLLTLGTTFPTLVYLSTVVYTFFGFPYAPIIASITFTTLLFYVIMRDYLKSIISSRVFIPVLILLFCLHPGLVYSAVTGRSIGIILFFFYMLFRSLFNYYKTQTTFALSMASIYLTCLVFCNYNFIWLLLALMPFVVLISLDGVKQAKHGSPIIQFYESVNNRSQRRKLTHRTFAIYIILFLLPIVSILLFELLNSVHAGNSTYYLTSQYSNWATTGTVSIGDTYLRNLQNINIKSQIQVIFQIYVLCLTPMLILVFVMFKGKLYELLTLIAPFIFLAIILINNQVYLTVEYYLLFLIMGILGVLFYAGKKYNIAKIYPIITLAAVLNVLAGYFYFKKSSDVEEKQFLSSIKALPKSIFKEKVITEDYRMATYISTLVGNKLNFNNKILMDDAAAYKIVAQMKKLDNVVLPTNVDFITCAENPKAGIKYICVAKKENILSSFTVLNDYNLKRYQGSFTVAPTIMFETDNWAIYKLNTHLE